MRFGASHEAGVEMTINFIAAAAGLSSFRNAASDVGNPAYRYIAKMLDTTSQHCWNAQGQNANQSINKPACVNLIINLEYTHTRPNNPPLSASQNAPTAAKIYTTVFFMTPALSLSSPTCMTDDSRKTAELKMLGRNGPSGMTDGSSGLACPSHSRVTASSAPRCATNCPSTDKHACAQNMREGGRAADRRRSGCERLAQ